MLEKFNKPINPHNNSPIPEKVNLTLKEEGIRKDTYQDKETGELYFPRNSYGSSEKTNQKEHFIALLIKGIFHSSDIIKIGEDEYFSRKINLENVESGKPFEKEAEIFLLKSIIGDYDKGIYDDGTPRNIQEENSKFAHFDYEKSFLSDSFKKIHENSENSENSSNIFYEFCKENKFFKEDIYNFSIQVNDKLNALEQTLKDKNFIIAILKKSKFNPQLEKIAEIDKLEKDQAEEDIFQDEKNFIRVQELLLTPLREIKKLVQKELKRRE